MEPGSDPADPGLDQTGQERAGCSDPRASLQRTLVELSDARPGPDESRSACSQAIRHLGRIGLLEACLPAERSSSWTGAPLRNVLLDALPRTLSIGLGLGVATQLLAIAAARALAGSSREPDLAEPLIRGRTIAAVALGRPNPDAAGIRATSDGDGWLLDGTTAPAVSLLCADALMIRAALDGGGDLLALLEPDTEGVCLHASAPPGGPELACLGTASLDQVRVHPRQVVAGSQLLAPVLPDLHRLERRLVAAVLTGCAAVCVDQAAQQRSAQRSSRDHILARLAARIEAVRCLLDAADHSPRQAGPRPDQNAMALLLADELATDAAACCLELGSGPTLARDETLGRFLTRLATRSFTVDARDEPCAAIAVALPAGPLRQPSPALAHHMPPDPAPEPPPATDRDVTAAETAAEAGTGPEDEGDSTPDSSGLSLVERTLRSLPGRIRPSRVEGWTSTLHFVLSASDHPEWTIRIDNGTCTVHQGLIGTADCLVRMSQATFISIERGSINPQVAFMMRKVKVSDLGQMMRFIKAFGLGRRS